MNRRDLLIAPVGEAFLILVAALAGWLTRQPLIFASLGPTAYELIETPHRRTARPYCIFVGHLVGVGSAWLALFAARASHTPPVSGSGVPLPRVEAVVIAAALTTLLTLLLRASQPAAIATSLLITTGVLPRPIDAVVIMSGVLLMILIGEPVRRWRLNEQAKLGPTLDERS
jgi:CBS domain-containing membrane protein